MHGARSYLPALAAAMVGLAVCSGGCVTPSQRAQIEEEAFDRLVDDTLKRINKQNLDKAAWWFRPYYGELVDRLHRGSHHLIGWITGLHGSRHAVRELDPFLRSARGDKLILIATLVHADSYGLHPEARSILSRADQADELVVEALHGFRGLGWDPDEAARQEAGAAPEDWKKMTPDEKWRRLRGAWWHATRSGDTNHDAP